VRNYLGLVIVVLGFVFFFVSGILRLFSSRIFIEWEIFGGHYFSLEVTYLLDWVSVSFTGLVMLISGVVIMYCSGYIVSDSFFFRFIILVRLFVFSIIIMILSPNLVRILLGWDGLGLVSYCLVIYYHNVKSANAGMLTILSNRVGDVAILLCIAWLFNLGGWNFFFSQILFKDELIYIIILVVLAAITKSAQIPFSAWLPAAIAAPTPVSALVHSSTLVTAGVYLLIRFNELLGVRYLLFFLSVITIFLSGLGANFEMDLKKIIALSTLSQLGVIIISLSLGIAELAYFHLLAHALFKSLLFLCAGVYIHGSVDIQDIRHLGGASYFAPLTSFYFLGCSLALCGFPFISGFYSKDLILETLFGININLFIYFIVLLSTFFTITYSIRLFFFILIKPINGSGVFELAEVPIMIVPIGLLFIFSVIRGSIIVWWEMPLFVVILPVSVKILIVGFILVLGLVILSGVVKVYFNILKFYKNLFLVLSFLGSM
jgi:NADH-ubiquinone oxidoreductase chain 5